MAAARLAACAPWSALLPEAAEGLLTEPEQRALDAHLATCTRCAEELADAQRGAAWLGLLKAEIPEPSPNLLGNILARTVGDPATQSPLAFAGPAVLAPVSAIGALPALDLPSRQADGNRRGRFSRWLGLGDSSFPALQPRLAMTAAMAFFSICLTLNLLGISVRDLQAKDLNSYGLQRAVANRGASLVRSFEGIRTVYRVESRVNEWMSASSGQSSGSLQVQ